MFGQVMAQTVNPGAFAASRKGRVRIHQPASQIADALLADRPVAFEDEAEAVEARMATGATLVFPVPGQHFAQSEIAQLPLVAGQLGNFGRWRRDLFAQQTTD